MRIDEIDRRGFLKGFLGAAAAGATSSALGRVLPGEDPQPGINRLTGKPNTPSPEPAREPGAQMPNQNLETAEKVERLPDGNVVIQHGGQTYEGIFVPKDSPTPRGAKAIKIQQAQLGIRGIGNYITYLLPNGKAYIYK